MMPASGLDRDAGALGPLGVEMELLAPEGKSRRDLAAAIAARFGARARRFFHPQGEPSKAPNTPFFENLTLGFVVEDARGRKLAECVDDLTLQDDLDRGRPPRPGWYRIVSDDVRLLRLTMRHADAESPLRDVLKPIAKLFGTAVHRGQGGMVRVADSSGSPVALGAPLPGERERPCELVTPPICEDHLERLEALLSLARGLHFTIPAEGALHLHFDGAPLCSAATIANLVRCLGIHGEALKDRVGTNPRCRRLGLWPAELFELVASPGFVDLDWPAARDALSKVNLTKYCDFNLINLVNGTPEKHTFEVRVLPVWLESQKVIDAADLFSSILHWARDHRGRLKPIPHDLLEILHPKRRPEKSITARPTGRPESSKSRTEQ